MTAPAAAARAEREHEHRLRAAPRSGAVLRQRSDVRVVVDRHRQSEPVGHPPTEVERAEGNVDRAANGSRALVDLRRKPEAHGDDAFVAERLHRLVEGLEDVCLRGDRRRCLAVALDGAVGLDEAGEDLRPAEVYADHAFVHRRRIT